jgi:hypothetical protein
MHGNSFFFWRDIYEATAIPAIESHPFSAPFLCILSSTILWINAHYLFIQLAALSNAARSIFVHETAPSFASARDKRGAILSYLSDLAKVMSTFMHNVFASLVYLTFRASFCSCDFSLYLLSWNVFVFVFV